MLRADNYCIKVYTVDGHEIGQRVREARLAKGWSLRQLAEKSDVSHGYISQLERGEVPKPGIDRVLKLYQALSLDTQELLTGDVEPLHGATVEDLIAQLAQQVADRFGDPSKKAQAKRLFDNYVTLLTRDGRSAQKLIEESDWLRRNSEDAKPQKLAEDQEPYKAEG